MEPKPTTLGSSLAVPYVQELVKEPLTAIPPRYLRPDQDPPFACNTNLSQQLPIIDMDKLLSDSGDSTHSELENLHMACRDWGFFQVLCTLLFPLMVLYLSVYIFGSNVSLTHSNILS